MDYYDLLIRNKPIKEEYICCDNKYLTFHNGIYVCKMCGIEDNKLINEMVNNVKNYEIDRFGYFKTYIGGSNYYLLKNMRRVHIWLYHNHTEKTFYKRKDGISDILKNIKYNRNDIQEIINNKYNKWFGETMSMTEVKELLKEKEIKLDLNKYKKFKDIKKILKDKYEVDIYKNKHKNRGNGITLSFFYFILRINYDNYKDYYMILELIKYLDIDNNKYNFFLKKYVDLEDRIYIPKDIIEIVDKLRIIDNFNLYKFLDNFNKNKIYFLNSVKGKRNKVQDRFLITLILLKMYPDNKDYIITNFKYSKNNYKKYNHLII